MKRWLTEEIDTIPYFHRENELKEIFSDIEEKRIKIDRYFEVHPKAKEIVITPEKRKTRFMDSALSYFALESGEEIDIIPTKDKSQAQIENEKKQLDKIMSYQQACELMHNAAMSDNEYLDERLLVKAHTKLYENDEERRNFVRYRFRNENDNEIIVGQGYFNPVPGDLVGVRMSFLLMNYNTVWYNDHPIVKGAKFVTEYVRIQPHMDGNKRTALMALNFILEKNGLPDIFINKSQADELFQAIKTAMLDRDVTDLAMLIAKNVQKRYDNRIEDIREYRIKGYEKIQSLENDVLKKDEDNINP